MDIEEGEVKKKREERKRIGKAKNTQVKKKKKRNPENTKADTV